MSIGLLLFFLFVLVANVAIGYIIAVLLGIGPADFRTAWAHIKLSLASPNGDTNSSRMSQVKSIIGFVTSLGGRFKKHAPPPPGEIKPLSVAPVEEPKAPAPIPPTQESNNNNPAKPEQPNTPP
jgi:hypothetical protein